MMHDNRSIAETLGVDLSNPDAWFWDSTELLRHVLQFAQSNLLQPWAVLLHVLVNINARIPVGHVLPPVFGAAAPVSLYAVFVTGSGGGKDTSKRASLSAVTFQENTIRVGDDEIVGQSDDLAVVPLGSAEGLNKLFRRYVPGKPATKTTPAVPAAVKWVRHAVIITVDESKSLESLSNSSGDLLNQLKSAWSGGTLGYSWSDESKSVTVPQLSYRLNVTVSGQPTELDTFLRNDKDGFLQRWLWVPTGLDEYSPTDIDTLPETPEPMIWRGIDYHELAPGELVPFGIPDWYIRRIKQERIDAPRDLFADRINGHRTQLVERVACTFAAAESRLDVTDLDIQLADHVVERSDRLREEIRAEADDKRRAERRAKATEVAEDKMTELDTMADLEQQAMASVLDEIPRIVAQRGDPWISVGGINRWVTGTRRKLVPSAVEALIQTGALVSEVRRSGNRRESTFVRVR